MLAQYGAEFMVFAFLVLGIDRIEIVQRVFVLADLIGLDVGFKNALSSEFLFVGVAPDVKTIYCIAAIFKGFQVFAFF